MVAAPAMTEWSVSGEKWKGKSSVVLLRKGKKQKCTKRVMANAASIKEIEAVLMGPMTAGPSQQQSSELIAKALDQHLGKLVKAINCNTTELSRALKQFKWLTGVTATNYLQMTKLLNQLGKPKLARNKVKARVVKDKEEEFDWEDGDEDEADK